MIHHHQPCSLPGSLQPHAQSESVIIRHRHTLTDWAGKQMTWRVEVRLTRSIKGEEKGESGCLIAALQTHIPRHDPYSRALRMPQMETGALATRQVNASSCLNKRGVIHHDTCSV